MPPPVPRRSARLLLPAVVLDAIAALGLVLVGVGGFLRGDALGLVFVGAALGLAGVPGVVLSALVLAARRSGRAPLGTALLIAASVLCALSVGPTVLGVALAAPPNPAAVALRPMEEEVREVGGVQVCTNGDPGLGPDNTAPWRESYWTVPVSAPLDARLAARAAASGFALRPVPTTDSRLPGTRTSTASARAHGRVRDLTVETSTSGIPLRCDPGYGRIEHPPSGSVLVDLTLTIDGPR